MASAADASGAVAGQDEAESCAAQLPPQGQMMFRAVSPHVKPDSDIRTLMREHVRPLVMTGRFSRDVAQENARAVGKCLVLLKR